MKLQLKFPRQRTLNKLGFWLCIMLVVIAVYLQAHLALTPCPLCIAQRLMIFSLALIFLFGWLKLVTGVTRILHGVIVFLFAGAGGALALRQVWLEQLPPGQAPPCGPSFSYMLENFPFHETLLAMLQGTAECAQVSWRFFDLTIPTWTLIFFGVFALIAIISMFREDEK